MKYEGKNIGILGLGKSGYWSAKLAKSLNNNVFVSDSNENINQIFIDDLKMLGVELEIGVHSNQILKSDIIIKSPGIPNNSKILRKINAERIPVISEIEFAGNLSKSKNICITGTNGKTTTVSLLTDILSTQKKVLKSGNIGIPFSKIVLENRLYEKNEIDFCILELSSFQLEHCETLKKEISVILNISVDHMDRYNSIEEYFEAKLNIFNNSKHCFFNYDDKFLKNKVDDSYKNIMPYSITEEEGNYFYKKNKIFSNDLSISLDTNSISLQGIHNVSNIIIASEIASMIGVSNDNIHKAIREFESLEHRFEHFNSYKGIDFINDSKSTNYHSLIAALKKYKDIILICGGQIKSNNINILDDSLGNIKKVIIIGEESNTFHKYFQSKVTTVYVQSLDKAVVEMSKFMKTNTDFNTFLFSPGAASFDQYNNFEERGRHFNKLISKLSK